MTPPLPVPLAGGFDYVTVDAAHRRVYAAHIGARSLLIVDADTGTVLHQITVGPMHGVAYNAAGTKVYTGNGDDKSVSESDPATFAVVRTVTVAGPVDAIWDLAQAAWQNAQLHDDDIAERCDLPDAAARARQLKLILDGYGLPRRDRDDFVDKMITIAVHDARAEAISAGVTPEAVSATTPTGYPYAWAITWRARSASWMLTNRTLLQRAIT